MRKHPKILWSILFTISLVFQSCSSSSSDSNGNGGPTPPPGAPSLDRLFGAWLSSCVDLGMGLRAQLAVRFNEEDLAFGVMLVNWSQDDCAGTFALSSFEGDPLLAYEESQTFGGPRVEGIPDDFLVLKTVGTDDISDFGYTLIHFQDENTLNILIDYKLSPTTWAGWLDLPEVQDFVDDPDGYEPLVSGDPEIEDKQVFHFTKAEVPDPLVNFYGNWLSACGGYLDDNQQYFIRLKDNGDLEVALLDWSDPDDCIGTYELLPPFGGIDPIADTALVNYYSYVPILGTGADPGFFVLRFDSLDPMDINPEYIVVAFRNESEANLLFGYPENLGNWDDWTQDIDVQGFVADPIGFEPINVNMNLTLEKVSGLPPQ